jgi:hypothetical protein
VFVILLPFLVGLFARSSGILLTVALIGGLLIDSNLLGATGWLLMDAFIGFGLYLVAALLMSGLSRLASGLSRLRGR